MLNQLDSNFLYKNINSTPDLQQYIIAIGASAGGLQEIKTFFDNTPIDGVSYVIIQHLSADYKSVMASLLAKHSKLEICEAKNDMFVEKNKIYLIPSKNYMTIREGRLILTDKHKTGTPHLTINTFFNSLALDIGNKAIAILLSGTGSDGTQGVKAIKDAGGMVIASDPSKSEFSEMPSNAIDTGLVDFVLVPEQMPMAIENYVKKRENFEEDFAENERDEKIRVSIIEFMKERLPIDFSDYKQATILRRIKRRANHHNINNLEAYLNLLKANPDELASLSQDFLISVTSFFRDKEAFDFLEANVITDIINNKPTNEELKIWVPGCATGEEAYSFAILIKEELNKAGKNIEVKIFATDIDNIALDFAKNGTYDDNVIKNISPERLKLFFTKENNGYKVSQAIRKMLIFAHHDLVKNPPYCNMDLISCRNLLIYMTPSLQKKVFNILHFGLKQGGYLFLGSSENAQAISSSVEAVNKQWRIYKNIHTRRAVNSDLFSMPASSNQKNKPSEILLNENHRITLNNLSEFVSQEVMNELGYMLVCVDEDNQVVKTFGDTSEYLLQKNFTLNLAELTGTPFSCF